MIRFQLFGFPVVIHWFFWVNCALLGGALDASSPERLQMLIGFLLVAFAHVAQLGSLSAFERLRRPVPTPLPRLASPG